MKIRQYYQVTYYSPGSFFSETNEREFENFSLKEFTEKASTITQRYGAKPYGFKVQRLEEIVDMPDGFKCEPKIIEKAKCYYFINAEVVFSKDLDKKTEGIFISNLENNCQGVGIISRNSYRFNYFFNKEDFIVNSSGEITRTGRDKDIMEYRKLVEEKRKTS